MSDDASPARAHDRARRRHLLDGTTWVSCKPGYFLTVPVLAQLFRRLFLDKLIAAHKANRLKFFSDHVPLADFMAFAA
jgi:hypothetical protein